MDSWRDSWILRSWGTRVYIPDNHFLYTPPEPKEHPLQRILSDIEKSYKNSQRQIIFRYFNREVEYMKRDLNIVPDKIRRYEDIISFIDYIEQNKIL